MKVLGTFVDELNNAGPNFDLSLVINDLLPFFFLDWNLN